MPSRIWAMGVRMEVLALSGASRPRDCSEGSSMFTDSRSASRGEAAKTMSALLARAPSHSGGSSSQSRSQS